MGTLAMSPQDATRERAMSRLIGAGLLRSLRRDESGATAIEFAMIATPFFALLFGIIQLGYRFFTAEALDTATAEAARTIMTGVTQSNVAVKDAATFRDQVLCSSTKRLLPTYMDCSKVVIDVRTITYSDSFSITASGLLTGTIANSYAPGAGGDMVVVRIAYGLPAVAPGLTGGGAITVSGSDVYPLMGVAVIRNEPFSGS
jgi:Flp pilus assembly protein TadG